MTNKIGFCCKHVSHSSKGLVPTEGMNIGSTTVAWLKRQTREAAEQKLWDLMERNIAATLRLIETVGDHDERLRMVRIGSDVLPVYTEPSFSYFWRQGYVRSAAERGFAKIGDLARIRGVRLSFHPGQFCCLASDSDGIVARSIEEFEYHADMARWMGYGSEWHDHGFKINVHVSGRRGPTGIRAMLHRLSPEARNLITLENDENGHGLDDIIDLGDEVALVLDIHHHLIRTHEYIRVSDDRVKRVIDSWRGVRPIFHYSMSREDYLQGHDANTLPDMEMLLAQGYRKQKLRAHSDMMWNKASNKWAYEHWEWADCMVEAKSKNLASQELFEVWKSFEYHV